MPGTWPDPRKLWGGHLGPSVSALVDGQLDEEATERAWTHVLSCASCRRQVAREGWVKTQLAQIGGNEPSARLLGSLYELDPSLREANHPVHPGHPGGRDAARDAWAAVERLEDRGRTRRRAGLAVVGAGSVSVAVLGLSTLSGATLGIGGAPAGPPSSALTRSTPTAEPASPSSSPSSPSSSPGPSVWRTSLPGWVTHGSAPDGTRSVAVRPR